MAQIDIFLSLLHSLRSYNVFCIVIRGYVKKSVTLMGIRENQRFSVIKPKLKEVLVLRQK